MASPKSLTLAPALRFTCSSCGDCCRGWPVPVSPDDAARINALDWAPLASGEEKSFSETIDLGPGERHEVLRRTPDGACIFLSEDSRCRIHEKHGAEAKPIACQIYPFQRVILSGGRQRITATMTCPSVAGGEGKAPSNKDREELGALFAQAQKHWPKAELEPELPFDGKGLYSPSASLEIFQDLLLEILAARDLPFSQRLLIFTRAAQLMLDSRLTDLSDPARLTMAKAFVKGHREQVRLGQVLAPFLPLSSPERLMMRQLLGFQTLDHDPDLEGLGALAAASASRLWHGLTWTLGRGSRDWTDTKGKRLHYRDVLKKAPATTIDAGAEPLSRLLELALGSAKILELSQKRRSFVAALGLLLRQIPAAVFFARAAALARASNSVEKEDWIRAIRLIERSFGRMPITGGQLGQVWISLLGDFKANWSHIAEYSGK